MSNNLNGLPPHRILKPNELLQIGDIFVYNNLFEVCDSEFLGQPALFDYTKNKYYYVRPTTLTLKQNLEEAINDLAKFIKHRYSCRVWNLKKDSRGDVCDCGLIKTTTKIYTIIDKEIR